MPRHADRAAQCPKASLPLSAARARRCRPRPLDAAEGAFQALVTGPGPLSLNPGRLAPGLPRRRMPLDELRALLLHPATRPAARNKVWAELVRRARGGDPAWVVGLAGVAMPGLRRAATDLYAAYRGDPEDLQAEVLAGFLAALRALDLDDLERVPLASRLCWAAWRAGQKLAYADADWSARRRYLDESREGSAGPAPPWGHPDFVLAAAVRAGILAAAEAELIGRNRLEGVPLAAIAAELGVSHSALCHRRRRAEARLVSAIGQGKLAGPGLSGGADVKKAPRPRICSVAGATRTGAGRMPPAADNPAADREGRRRPASGPAPAPGPATSRHRRRCA